jgi:hypothetical protein
VRGRPACMRAGSARTAQARRGSPKTSPCKSAHLRVAPGARASRPHARRRRAHRAGTPGLPKNLPLQKRAPEGCAGCAGVPPARAPEAHAPRKGSVPVLYDPPALCFHTGSRKRLGVLMSHGGRARRGGARKRTRCAGFQRRPRYSQCSPPVRPARAT